mmetsp:Transcript_24287/g.55714  ORF Transcript_24287/g.55714 Transcript_24287/m.55714 type:complete len:271 (-) Transcript_24287:142-954(-)
MRVVKPLMMRLSCPVILLLLLRFSHSSIIIFVDMTFVHVERHLERVRTSRSTKNPQPNPFGLYIQQSLSSQNPGLSIGGKVGFVHIPQPFGTQPNAFFFGRKSLFLRHVFGANPRHAVFHGTFHKGRIGRILGNGGGMHQYVVAVVFERRGDPIFGIDPNHESGFLAHLLQIARHVDEAFKIAHHLVPKEGCIVHGGTSASALEIRLFGNLEGDLRPGHGMFFGWIHPGLEGVLIWSSVVFGHGGRPLDGFAFGGRFADGRRIGRGRTGT